MPHTVLSARTEKADSSLTVVLKLGKATGK